MFLLRCCASIAPTSSTDVLQFGGPGGHPRHSCADRLGGGPKLVRHPASLFHVTSAGVLLACFDSFARLLHTAVSNYGMLLLIDLLDACSAHHCHLLLVPVQVRQPHHGDGNGEGAVLYRPTPQGRIQELGAQSSVGMCDSGKTDA